MSNYRANKNDDLVFKGWDMNRFREVADRYSREEIDTILKPEAIEILRDIRNRVIVSSWFRHRWKSG